jgi:hypothetical protein
MTACINELFTLIWLPPLARNCNWFANKRLRVRNEIGFLLISQWEHHPHGSRFRILDVQGLPIRIATVLFLVCDLTEPSVRQLEIHESQTEGAKCPRVIVATKVDNASDLQTEDSQLMIRLLQVSMFCCEQLFAWLNVTFLFEQKVADRNQLPILFVSAKTNVQSLLDYIQDLVRSNCNEEAVQEWHATWG